MSSCVRENQIVCNLPLAGLWAEVDDDMMTDHYISFSAGKFSSYQSDNTFLCAKDTLWHSSEDNFFRHVTSSYSVVDGVLVISGKSHTVDVRESTLIYDGKFYSKFSGFTDRYYRDISIDKALECNLGGANLSADIHISNSKDGIKPEVESSCSWITNFLVWEDKVSFDVLSSDASREGSIVIRYPGAKEIEVPVSQKADRHISVEPAILYSSYMSQLVTATVDVTNPVAGKIVEVSSAAGWINATVSNNTLKVYMSENNTGKDRESYVTLSYPEADDFVLPVRQSFANSAITLPVVSYVLGPQSAEYSIPYSICNPRSGQTLSVTSTSSFISIKSIEADCVKFTIAANTGSATRYGDIRFSYNGETDVVAVTQNYVSLTLDKYSLSCSYTGGVYTFKIYSNSPWTINCDTAGVSWKVLSENNNGAQIQLTVEKNCSRQSRTMNIVVSAEGTGKKVTLTISQSAAAFSATATDVSVTQSASSSFSLGINTSLSWKLSSDCNWLTPSYSSGSGTMSQTIYVASNTSASSRSGVLIYTNDEYGFEERVAVTQVGSTLSISSPVIDFLADGSSVSVTVSASSNWSLTCDDIWVSLSRTSGSAGNYTVTLTASGNYTGAARRSLLVMQNTVSGEMCRSELSQPFGFLTASPRMWYSPVGGSSNSFTVDGNVAWSMSMGESWMSSSKYSDASRKSSVVSIQTSSNLSSSDRIGIVRFNSSGSVSDEITIKQPGLRLSLSESSWTINSSNQESTVLFIDSSIPWTLTSSASWLTASEYSYEGSRAVTLSCAENTSGSSRSATVRVYNSSLGVEQTVSVLQTVPSISVSSSSLTFPMNIASINAVTVVSNQPWIAQCDASWVRLDSYNGPAGTSTLAFTVNEDKERVARVATVTLTTQESSTSFEIVQTPFTISVSGVGSYPWSTYSYSSYVFAMRSTNQGVHSSDSKSIISVSVTESQPISFNYLVSSESNYDKLTITIDSNIHVNAVSGSQTGTVSATLTPGTHKIELLYHKDGTVNNGSDQGLIYNMRIGSAVISNDMF